MIYLFIHQNFPGQYKNLIRHLADQPGNRVIFISQPNANEMVGVEKLTYQPDLTKAENIHPFVTDFDRAVKVGMGVVDVCRMLAGQGVRPDVICGHAGWGEMLFVKDVFPDVPVLSYFEFYYHMYDLDVNFDPEYPALGQTPFALRTRNAVSLLSFDAADWGNVPTLWQRSVHPPEMRSRLTVIHEGVDTDLVRPDSRAQIQLMRDGVTLTKNDEVITYVARNLEPYRGFHIMMRSAREILRRRPKAHIIFVGGDGVSYGAPPPAGTNFREMMLRELGAELDLSRIHFLGQVPYDAYVRVLQVSSAHVYLTYPFVLSWSFVEAMSAGCAMIGSSTPPVMEIMKHGVNGLAVDFFSVSDIANAVDDILDHPDRMLAMRLAARDTAVQDYDLKRRILPMWTQLLDDLVQGRRPSLNVPRA